MLVRIYTDAEGSYEHEDVGAWKVEGGCLLLLTQERDANARDDGLQVTKAYGVGAWRKIEPVE